MSRWLVAVSAAGVLWACEDWRDLEARARVCQTCGADGGETDGGSTGDAGGACGAFQTLCAGACRDLSSDSANCGACGVSCESLQCARGRCEPLELGQFPETPLGASIGVHHLAVSADSVFVAVANFRPGLALPDGGPRPFLGQVLKLRKNVFAREVVLAADQPTPQFLVVRGDRVFFTNWESADGGEELRSVGVSGSTTTTSHFSAPGGLFGLSAWENDLALVSNQGSSLFRWQPDGGVERYAIPATGMLLVAAEGPFAVAGSTTPAALWRVDRAGGDGGVTSLVSNLGKPWGLVIDDGGVFFSDTVNGTVSRVPLAGGDVVELARQLRSPRGLAADSRALYVVEHVASGRVVRLDRVDGGLTDLATNQSLPTAIVVDEEAVYWVNSGDGRVQRLRKR